MSLFRPKIVDLALFVLCSSLPLVSWAATGPLTAQVDVLQQRLEEQFEGAGSIIELVYEGPDSNHVVDITETGDSAIWTGVYLASQCLRYAATPDPTERARARTQVLWALDSVERLFDVTGTGLLTRFTFNPTDPFFRDLKIAGTAGPRSGWVSSTTKPGWLWIQGTSRDQYTGIFFGLGVCNQIMPDAEIHARTGKRITEAVSFLEKNDWTIPTPKSDEIITSDELPLDDEVTWLHLAALQDPQYFQEKFENAMNELKGDPRPWLEPSRYNNILEYYGWNLGYLRYYTLLSFDQDPGDRDFLTRLFDDKVWDQTWSHMNSMFTYMKLGTIGRESPRDDVAREQANESLWELAFKSRRDFRVVNSTNRDIPRDLGIKMLGLFCKVFGLTHIHFVTKLDMNQALRPLPMKRRPPSDFMWQRSPFTLDGGGEGTIESHSVDTLIAYWLGRYHGLLSGKD